jgi:hypothetical protein
MWVPLYFIFFPPLEDGNAFFFWPEEFSSIRDGGSFLLLRCLLRVCSRNGGDASRCDGKMEDDVQGTENLLPGIIGSGQV